MSTFEHRKGSFTLFRNQKRTKDTQPHLRGEGVDLNGQAIEISVWEKEGRAGIFYSCTMKVKEGMKPAEPRKAEKKEQDFSDDVPF